MIEATVLIPAQEKQVQFVSANINFGAKDIDEQQQLTQITLHDRYGPMVSREALLPAEQEAIEAIMIAVAQRSGKFKEGSIRTAAEQVKP